jgi:hypothetical protein
MGDLLKGVVQLNVSGDGRTADNWNSYRVQLRNTLAGKEIEGIRLHLILSNTGAGAMVSNPGGDEAAWIAAAPPGMARDANTFRAAAEAWEKWSTANMVAHSCIMMTMPPILHDACAQREVAYQLWQYLETRFSAASSTSMPLLAKKLFTTYLRDFQGVSSYLTAIAQVSQDLERGGFQVPQFMLVGAILTGLGDQYLTTQEFLLALPAAQQTATYVSERILEAEKNEALRRQQGEGVPAMAAAKPPRRPCGYVRQLQGRRLEHTPGTRCTGPHSRERCFARQDDEWLRANPTKTSRTTATPFRMEVQQQLQLTSLPLRPMQLW